jgi:hypothetical protein
MSSGQPQNRNFLSPTGFKFSLKRAPKVSFFCNSANISRFKSRNCYSTKLFKGH